MKTFTFTCVFTLTTLLTGCQSMFQFVDSPIPVTAPPTQSNSYPISQN